MTEPTGVLTEALERCGVSPEQVRENLTLNAEGANDSAGEGHAGASSADGTRLGATRQIQLSHTPADYRVTYELGFPQQPRFNTQLIEVTLLPQDSGTLAQVTSSWLRAPEANLPRSLRLLRRPLGAVIRPVTRWTTTIQASTLAEQLRAAATRSAPTS
nr:hypothetical protein [Rothia nasimurium]